MSQQQLVQSKPFTDGSGRRRVDRDVGNRLESKSQTGKSCSSSFSSAALANGNTVTGLESPSRDRLLFLITCLLGHRVEVQVKNGSIFSGIFHSTHAENDFGIILKMARQTKDGSFKGQKLDTDSISKAPSKTLIIPSKEFVQVVAKDVQLTVNGFANGHACEKRLDIMTDSFISQSHYMDVERDLERWTPDKDDPQCPELENIFDNTWGRNWDQFETNEALFGVKSTFDEELYTTKLERGPQMRELEREALRIAREIEGEETLDPHLAEERGIVLPDDFELDEESRFSSVFRGVDDGRSEENEDIRLDAWNAETFGGSSESSITPPSSIKEKSFSDVARGKISDGTQASASCFSVDEGPPSLIPAGRGLNLSSSIDHCRSQESDSSSKTSSAMDDANRINKSQVRDRHRVKNNLKENAAFEEAQTSKYEVDAEKQPLPNTKKSDFDKGALSPSASAYAPVSATPMLSASNSPNNPSAPSDMGLAGESSESLRGKAHITPWARPGSATSSTSDCVAATSVSSCPTLSPSSSMGSLSSEKSALNPYAKEFKFNPNAKSFKPSLTPLRPPGPVSEGSFYLPTNVSAVPHMHSLPMGVGIGHSFGAHQPIIYNPHAASMQSPQAYIHPHGPLYGQQMILGQPRPVLYMPSYPPELQFKGRDF